MRETYYGVFLVGFMVTLLSTPLVRILAHKVGAVDIPNHRKVHNKPMPRMGGVAIYLGFVAAILLLVDLSTRVMGLLLGGTIILLLGIVDDIKDISPKTKLLGQTAASLVVILFGIKIEFITNPFDSLIFLGSLSIPITLFWLVGVTNAVNLIDGLDGLASGISAIALFTFSYIAYVNGQFTVSLLTFLLAGCILGFLRYNFYPATIFLGDSGSMFLGFNIAALAVFGFLKGVTLIALVIPLIILGVPIFDTLFAIVRRRRDRRPIFQADKKHIHHRLLNRGLSHWQAVLVIYLLSLCFSASALWFSLNIKLF